MTIPPRSGLSPLVALAMAGCVPDTDLFDERRPSGAAPAGTAGELLQPTPGSIGVPRNLAAVLVRLGDALTVERVLRLRPREGSTTLGGTPADDPCAGPGRCYRLPVASALAASAAYVVEVVDGGRAAVVGAFETAAAFDAVAPEIQDLTVAVSGPCVRVRWSTDEPAQGAIILRAADAEKVVSAGAGLTIFDVGARLAPLPPLTDGEVIARAVDAAGNGAESPAVALRTPALTAPVVITEVLANAAGVEPTQELVELRNLGSEPVALRGMRLEDSIGGDTLPELELGAGAFAVVVPGTFNERPDKDTPVRSGTLVVRVDARLGGDGLGNAGEAVQLRDPDGVVISSYGGWVDVSSSLWSGKSVQRLQEDACDHPASWNRKPLAATPGW